MMASLTRPYGAYGTHAASDAARTAYAGEVREADTGWYMLGERAYSATLRRFLAPDRDAPFDDGGPNRYGYCGGDPIGRVDPSGHAWLNWLGTSAGLARTAGASRRVSSTSRINEGASTPATVASAAASVTDAVSITSAIDSVALKASDRPQASQLMGWISMGASVASGGVTLPVGRAGSPTARSGRARPSPRGTVELVTQPNIPAERLHTDASGNPHLATRWLRRSHTDNASSDIWAADTEITLSNFTNLFKTLAAKGVKEVFVYSGAHGNAYGDNWHADTGRRKNPYEKFFIEDFVQTRATAEAMGIRVRPVNMANLTMRQVQNRLAKSGVHIIGTCYGLADEVVMSAMKLPHVTLYRLNMPPP